MSTTETPTPAKRQTVASLKGELAERDERVRRMESNLVRLQMTIEDRGWTRVGNDRKADGLDLSAIQTAAEELRTWIVAGGIMKRIVEVRGNTIYGDGVGFKNFSKARVPFESAVNSTKLFSAEALKEINRTHGTDGTVVFLVHKTTKEIIRFGVEKMDDPFVDSMDRERIWFVRRSYLRVTPAKPQGEIVDEYYATDLCPPKQAALPKINQGGGKAAVKINKDYTAVVWAVNRQVGWPLGIPDLFASLQWAEKYTDHLKDQFKFAKALAQLAWQFRAQNTDEAKRMAATVAQAAVGASAVQTPGMDMVPMPGNSGVSFDNGKPLAAQAAAAGEITVEALLAEGATVAGADLDPDVKKMAKGRRDQATGIFKRIGKLLGAPNLEVIWPNLEEEDPFRDAQMIISAWDTGLYKPEEIRSPLAQRVAIPLKEGSTAPSDVLTPNTKSALKAAQDVIPKPDPATPVIPGKKPGTSAGRQNKQGKNALGVGKLSDGDNTARDRGETGK